MYSSGGPGQRPAEEVREHQHHHDREDRHVEELLGHVLDLQHGPPAEGQRRRQRARAGAAAPGRPAGRPGSPRPVRRARRPRVSAVVGAVLMPPPPLLAGVLSGEGEEDLVQAGLAQREVVHGDPRSGPAPPAPGRLFGRAPVGAAPADRGGQRHRVGVQLHRRVERERQHPLGLGPLPGVAQPQMDGAGADGRLQLALRALGDHLAVVDHGDAGGQVVGLVQVLRGQHAPSCPARRPPARCPTPGCGCAGRARSSARRGRAGRGC